MKKINYFYAMALFSRVYGIVCIEIIEDSRCLFRVQDRN
jgi:hypothetical protein